MAIDNAFTFGPISVQVILQSLLYYLFSVCRVWRSPIRDFKRLFKQDNTEQKKNFLAQSEIPQGALSWIVLCLFFICSKFFQGQLLYRSCHQFAA